MQWEVLDRLAKVGILIDIWGLCAPKYAFVSASVLQTKCTAISAWAKRRGLMEIFYC